jgi:predicted DNA-binding transcriptional regulator YafY
MRADRLLSILLLLQAKGRMTAHALAKRLEVSERTILRDMDALGTAGVPVMAERGVGGGWRLVDGYQTKLTGLTAPEIQTLFLGRPPKLLADLGLKDAAEAAWIKLQAALPIEVRAQAEFVRQRIVIDPRGWRDGGESLATLPVLLEALWRQRCVRFHYEKTAADSDERIAEPLGLVARGNVWYLVALKQEDTRTYRVSRIRDAAILDQPSRRPADFDLASHWEKSAAAFREKLPQFLATYLVDPAVMSWVRYRAWRLQEESAEGDRIRVRLRFDAEQEAIMFALSFGAGVELVEPAHLRQRVLEAARGTVTCYSNDEATASAAPSTRAAGRPDP